MENFWLWLHLFGAPSNCLAVEVYGELYLNFNSLQYNYQL